MPILEADFLRPYDSSTDEDSNNEKDGDTDNLNPAPVSACSISR